MSYKLSIE